MIKGFGYCQVGEWRAGQTPRIGSVLAIVEYDQRSRAFLILYGDEDRFIEWISDIHDDDEIMRAHDEDGGWTETAEEHLDRIGCSVSFRDWRP